MGMKTLIRAFKTAAMAGLMCLTAAQGSLAAEHKATESPRVAFDHFITAFNELDWEAFRSSFADEVSVFNPDIPEVASLHRLDGRADVEKTFRSVFGSGQGAAAGPHIVPENVRLEQFGETALVSFEFSRPSGSFGRRTVVLHQEKGRWLIVHIHASNVGAGRGQPPTH